MAGAITDVMVQKKADTAANDENASSGGSGLADSSGENARDISV